MNNLQRAMRATGMSEDYSIRGPAKVLIGGQFENFRHPNPPCSNHKNCVECTQQWRRSQHQIMMQFVYEKILTNSQASAALHTRVSEIEEDYLWLCRALISQGDCIMANWINGDRVAYLKAALPNLYPHAFPAQRLPMPVIDWRQARQCYREAFLVPYMSVETLQGEPRHLLSLLHFRTQHHYCEFVMLDKQEQRTAFELGALGLDYNPNCVDLSSKSKYGQLTNFDATKAHRWLIVGYPRAKLILDAQALLYSMLRRLVEVLIVKKHSPKKGEELQWKEFQALGCRTSPLQEKWMRYPDRAFAGPPVFDYDHLCELVASRRAEADDHLWLLQTDLSYAQDSIQTLMNASAMRHATKTSQHHIVAELVNTPRKRARNWHDFEAELCNLRHLASLAGKELHDLSTTSGQLYERALCALELMTVNTFLDQAHQLEQMLPTSPGFQRNYKFQQTASGQTGSSLKDIAMGGDVNVAYFTKESLHWCLFQLQGNVKDINSIDHCVLFNFLEAQLLKANSKERARFDQRLYDHVSDMAVIHEILSTLRLQQPLHDAGSLTVHDIERHQMAGRFWRIQAQRPAELTQAELEELRRIMIDFSRINLHGGRHNISALTNIVGARERLLAFWTRMCEMNFARVSKLKIPDEDKTFECSMLGYASSAEHHGRIDMEKAQLAELQLHKAAKKRKGAPKPASVTDPVQDPAQTEWGENKVSSHEAQPATEVKIKVETHAEVADADVPGLHGDVARSDTDETVNNVSVKSSSLKLFSRMFPSQTALDDVSIGKTRWQDFVAAMADAGFAASHGSGSAVTFTNTESKSSQASKIVVHRPHPDSELGPVMLRSIGKRMQKWFGWAGECFVARTNEDKKDGKIVGEKPKD